ncbi:MAG: MBL fold metallo-hydrolase RNA specificity domain-containing protein [Cyanobium sp. MAG06]|nr:MBL fold metallo-hydrolase RNA specificity domain-containing protein [Cyanobium sp. MAG06]
MFRFPNLYQTLTREESKTINTVKGCKIIIAGSGMSSGGRIVHHEKHYLGIKSTNLILVGYQAIGSLGRLLQDGVKNIKIQNEDIIVRADIDNIGGFSAHKDSDNLIKFVEENSRFENKELKKVFVVLGEPKSALFLSQRIQEIVGVETYIPEENEEVEI